MTTNTDAGTVRSATYRQRSSCRLRPPMTIDSHLRWISARSDQGSQKGSHACSDRASRVAWRSHRIAGRRSGGRPVAVTDPPRAHSHDEEAARRTAFRRANWAWTAAGYGTRSRSWATTVAEVRDALRRHRGALHHAARRYLAQHGAAHP